MFNRFQQFLKIFYKWKNFAFTKTSQLELVEILKFGKWLQNRNSTFESILEFKNFTELWSWKDVHHCSFKTWFCLTYWTQLKFPNGKSDFRLQKYWKYNADAKYVGKNANKSLKIFIFAFLDLKNSTGSPSHS